MLTAFFRRAIISMFKQKREEDFMPIKNILQPEIININHDIRLKKYCGICDFALEWYLDEETVYMVDGEKKAYTEERLKKMYFYLDERGELYFIEALKDGVFTPIGDVTFSPSDMPIVIGDKAFRRKGIGGQVIAALVNRGKTLGYKELFVREIYDWNEQSKRCFSSIGFTPYKKTERGYSYKLTL